MTWAEGPVDFAGDTGAEEGVDDESRAAAEFGDGSGGGDFGGFETCLGEPVQVLARITGDLLGGAKEQDAHGKATGREVAGGNETVAPVVAATADDDDFASR